MLHLSQWASQFVQNISMTIRHPLSLDPHIEQGKTSKEKKTHSLKGKKWEKPQGEQQRRDPSPRTDRHANRCRVEIEKIIHLQHR